MTNPLITISIPTYNSAKTLEKTLESVKNQTYKNIEIIVVDNYSTDNTKEMVSVIARSHQTTKQSQLPASPVIARSDSDEAISTSRLSTLQTLQTLQTNLDIRLFSHGTERSAQRNYGAKQAKGEYLLFIDSDMVLGENVIASCVEKIKQDESNKAIIIPEKSFGIGFWAECKKLEKSFYVGVDWMEGARFFERKAFEEVGGYDENITSGEDWDLSQRVGAKYKIERISPFFKTYNYKQYHPEPVNCHPEPVEGSTFNSNFIYHNEGRISLLKTIRKKFYYAKNFSGYMNKNKAIRKNNRTIQQYSNRAIEHYNNRTIQQYNNSSVKNQTSIINRYKLYFSNPKKLFANPLLGVGMLFMKICEFGFGGIGYLIKNKNNNKMRNIDIEKYSEIAPQYYSDTIPVLLKKYLDNTQYNSILDCGCGDGSLLYALEKNGYLKNRKIYAIDLSKNRINLVKNLNNQIIANVDSAEELDTIKDDSIDFFISTQVIEHVDQIKMLENINRVVRKNGIIYLSTVFKKWYGWYFYRCNGKWVLDPTHLREYQNDNELFDFIDKDKFEILENKKTLLYFPIIDFFVKRFCVQNRKLFNNKLLCIIRKIKIPIFGYYNWEIVLKKKE